MTRTVRVTVRRLPQRTRCRGYSLPARSAASPCSNDARSVVGAAPTNHLGPDSTSLRFSYGRQPDCRLRSEELELSGHGYRCIRRTVLRSYRDGPGTPTPRHDPARRRAENRRVLSVRRRCPYDPGRVWLLGTRHVLGPLLRRFPPVGSRRPRELLDPASPVSCVGLDVPGV